MSIKVFDRWDVEGILVEDPGLKRYICLEPRVLPMTRGRNIGTRFRKTRVFIVERLINKIGVSGHKAKKHFKTSGHNTGKSNNHVDIVERVLTNLETKTKENPIKVLVKAIENAAPREEIITIEYGGARYPKAVECAPQRRVDFALKMMTQGAYHKSFGNKVSIVTTLTNEILGAYNNDSKSVSIAKKYEMERQADSSR